jgi:DNA invertase Pin-like site-specific DNA recombinase
MSNRSTSPFCAPCAVPGESTGDVAEFHHHGIDRSDPYVLDRHNHINGIENFWNRAKRTLNRCNGIPRAHFPLFLKGNITGTGTKPMSHKDLTKAVAYFRTSSMTNVGEDKDTLKRQRAEVSSFAKAAGYHIVAEYSDDGVKGADPVDQRAGFAAILKHIAGDGVRTVLVETASRFARDLIVQETGWRFLPDAGINLIAADSPDSFLDETPTAVLIRQVLGAVSQFEKAARVAKLKATRERKKATTASAAVGIASQSRRRRQLHSSRNLRAIPLTGASAHCATWPPSLRPPAT